MMNQPHHLLLLIASLVLSTTARAQDRPTKPPTRAGRRPAAKPAPPRKPAAEPNAPPPAEPEPKPEPEPEAKPEAEPEPNIAPEIPEPSPTEAGHSEPQADEPTQHQPQARTPIVIAEDPDDQPATCSNKAMKRTLAKVTGAVVSVEGSLAPAVGFVFGEQDVVLTSFDVVEQGRGVEVVSANGIRAETEIIAIDRARNLAYLRTKRPLGATPLTAADGRVDIGDAIFAVGRDVFSSGAPKVSIHSGMVTGKRGRTFQSDALSERDLFVGGPVLDCGGHVVGVGSDRWSDSFVAIHEANELAKEIGVQPEYNGGWSMNHPSFGMVVHGENNLIGVGLSLGTALIGNDGWYFPVRASALYVASPRTLKTEHTEGFRGQLEAGIGYRFMLTGGELPLYLTPTVGVVGTYERLGHKLCAENCLDGDVLQRSTLESFRGAPTAGLAFQFGPGEIGYQLQLDVEHPAASRHQIFVGIQF